MAETEIRNGPNLYKVGKAVTQEGGDYMLYLCERQGYENQCLLQISTHIKYNGKLDRAAYILQELQRYARETEEAYGRAKKDEKVFMNYHFMFPELVDSFVQGGLRINVLTFQNVKSVTDLVPLSYIPDAGLRIDYKTGAWITGKLLKLFAFAHKIRISVGLTAGNNILIERDKHYVMVLDWGEARIHPGEVPVEIRCQDISQAAQTIVEILGGDLKTGFMPEDEDVDISRYAEYVLRLARGAEGDAERAHNKFYKIVDSIWPREFHHFTTKPLGKSAQEEA